MNRGEPRGAARSALLTAVLLTLGAATAGCASWPRRLSERPCCVDRRWATMRQPIWWHLFDVTVLEPVEQPLHVFRTGRKLLGAPMRAINLQDGQVPDSAFYTNRDIASISPEEVRWGPTAPEDLPVPPFTVTKPKDEGKTPGMFVRDSRDKRYLFKFDPIEAPELLSGAEVVTSKLIHALGYHVPSYEVVSFRPEEVHVKPGTMIDRKDGKVPFTDADLQAMLSGRAVNGVIRVASTKILDGEILGPARFKKFQDCADVRALRVAYAWVNNIDTKDHNSLMVWDGVHTVGYLIDFGTSLGADAGEAGPKHRCAGWLNIVDLKDTSTEVLTLGLHEQACDPQHLPVSANIGLFTTHLNPDRWKPYAPNVAFTQMTNADAEWMAGRLAQFTREQLAAAVSAGRYSNIEDVNYLIETLDARRRAIIEAYLDDDEDDDAPTQEATDR